MSNRRRYYSGFTLVEVTLALGIAAFCLLTVLGLLTVGSNSDAATFEQTRATNILAAVASDLRTFPVGATSPTPLYQINLTNAGQAADTYVNEDGQPNASAVGAQYRLRVRVTPGTAPIPTLVYVTLSWPAPAALSAAAGSVESMIVLDRN